MDTIVLTIIIVATALVAGFSVGLIIGRERKGESVGDLVIFSDGESYAMQLALDHEVVGVQPEKFLSAQKKIVLDIKIFDAVKMRAKDS